MKTELLSLRDDPFALLLALEQRLQTARVDLAAGSAQFWTGLGFRLGDRWLVAPREEVREVIALPVLAFMGSMAALFGGGVVAWLYADMSPAIYIARLREAISVTHFEVGMIKAPFMAFVIGIVACTEGLRVKGSAESLGLQTTISVVHSIFLVIVLDGMFAIFFASIGM